MARGGRWLLLAIRQLWLDAASLRREVQPVQGVSAAASLLRFAQAYRRDPGACGLQLDASALVAQFGHAESVEVMLNAGAEPDGPARFRQHRKTPLRLATYSNSDSKTGANYNKVIELLLCFGADPSGYGNLAFAEAMRKHYFWQRGPRKAYLIRDKAPEQCALRILFLRTSIFHHVVSYL